MRDSRFRGGNPRHSYREVAERINMAGNALTLDRIMAAAKGDDSILQSPALAKAVAEAEAKVAVDALAPFIKMLEKAALKASAAGPLPGASPT